MKKSLIAMLFVGCLGGVLAPRACADVTVSVDPGAAWLGYMNVSELPANGGGFVFGSPWGTVDLVATFDGPVLKLSPNVIADPNIFWYQDPTMSGNQNPGGPGAPGNKIMEANMYVENSAELVGEILTFEGTVLSNSFTTAHSTIAFIKDFASDYSSFNITTVPLTSPGDFSITLATDPTPGRHVQYGFATTGVNVWSTDVAPFGFMEVTGNSVSIPGDFDGDGAVGGLDFLAWQRGESPTAFSAADLATWQGAYNGGALAAVNSVPEPTSAWLAVLGSMLFWKGHRTR